MNQNINYASRLITVYPIDIIGVFIHGESPRELDDGTWERPYLPYWDLRDCIMETLNDTPSSESQNI